MSYAQTIKKILSDGNWHCILNIIGETGLSARNRISEMNKEEKIYSNDNYVYKYLGQQCSLEFCSHKATLYMYKLNPKWLEAKNNIENFQEQIGFKF